MIAGNVAEEYLFQYLDQSPKANLPFSSRDLLSRDPDRFDTILHWINGNEKNEVKRQQITSYLTWRKYMLEQYELLRQNINDTKKKVIPPEAVTSPDGTTSLTNVFLPLPQTSEHGCWSVSLQLLLRSRGVNLSQEAIRAYVPDFGETFLMNTEKSFYDDKAGAYFDMIRSTFIKPESTNPYTRAELVKELCPNTATRRFCVSLNAGILDHPDEFRAMKATLAQKITDILQRAKSPICVNVGGHYVTIYGIRGETLFTKNSDAADLEHANDDSTYTLDDLIYRHEDNVNPFTGSFTSFRPFDFTYLEDVSETNGVKGFSDIDGLHYDEDGQLVLDDSFTEAENAKAQIPDEQYISEDMLSRNCVNISLEYQLSPHFSLTETICPPDRLQQVEYVPYEYDLYSIREKYNGMIGNLPKEIARPLLSPEKSRKALALESLHNLMKGKGTSPDAGADPEIIKDLISEIIAENLSGNSSDPLTGISRKQLKDLIKNNETFRQRFSGSSESTGALSEFLKDEGLGMTQSLQSELRADVTRPESQAIDPSGTDSEKVIQQVIQIQKSFRELQKEMEKTQYKEAMDRLSSAAVKKTEEILISLSNDPNSSDWSRHRTADLVPLMVLKNLLVSEAGTGVPGRFADVIAHQGPEYLLNKMEDFEVISNHRMLAENSPQGTLSVLDHNAKQVTGEFIRKAPSAYAALSRSLSKEPDVSSAKEAQPKVLTRGQDPLTR